MVRISTWAQVVSVVDDMPKRNPSQINIFGDYFEVVANNTGNRFEFDLEMLESIRGYAWNENENGYLVCRIKGKKVRAHHIVAGKPTRGKQVDHKDRNKRNNRKLNLRHITLQQNCINRRLRRDNKTGFKGVNFHKGSNKFEASIRVDGKLMYLGKYNTAKRAAMEYDKAALVHFGEFAVTNKMLGLLD